MCQSQSLLGHLPIESAQYADAAEIARVHVLSWQLAYQGLLPAEMLAGLSVETRTRQWQSWLERPHQSQVYVARAEQQVVGFVCGGPIRDEVPPFKGEIYALYVLPDWQGRGVGKALLDFQQAALCQAGLKKQLVWFLTTNQLARNFYRRQGGIAITERQVEIGDPPVSVAETAYGWHFDRQLIGFY